MSDDILYKAQDYKQFLRSRLSSNDPFPVTQAALAKAAGCKASYLSQCLNGKVHLLPEQLHAIGLYLRLEEDEIDYLLLLLQVDRSGSSSHRSFIKRRLSLMKEAHARISNRLQRAEPAAASSLADLQAYYNDWFMIAVHMLCTIPGIRSEDEIAKRLGLTRSQAQLAVKTLVKLGLVEQTEGCIRATLRHIHLGDQDPLIGRHHANWRMQAALRSQPAPTSDLHYTAVYSLGRSDAAEIREDLAKVLMKIRAKVKPSPEECVVAFGMDWFHLS